MTKKKILVVHQQLLGLERTGGAEALCAWTLQALCKDYDVTLAVPHQGGVIKSVDLLNAQYGTSLSSSDFKIRALIWPILQPVLRCSWILHIHLYMHSIRRIAHEYDFCISTYNEFDFGDVPAVQYLHYPMLKVSRGKTWRSLFANAYRSLVARLLGFKWERMLRNRIYTCSLWTKHIIEKNYPTSAEVLYPPVAYHSVPLAWKDREHTFVFVGRISPEKRVEDCIEIIAGVRAMGHQVSLLIVGPAYTNPYAEVIRTKARNLNWVHFHGNATAGQLSEMLTRARYGINGTEDEQFGIALAQMRRAGCVVFAPNKGGQIEVLGHDSRLLFGDIKDAVVKIDAVISNEKLSQELHERAIREGGQFSPEYFMKRVQQLVQKGLVTHAQV